MLFFVLGTASCVSNTSGNAFAQLDASSFNQKWQELKENSILLDVRTQQEFEGGHIEGAQNFDYNSSDFQSKIKKLDKQKTIFVYCLSGGRSGAAVSILQNSGFNNIIELEGGMMSWRSISLPEVKGKSKNETSSFNTIVTNNKLVLVDFYADWCAPCKKMKPTLNELSQDKVVFVAPLNADIEQQLVSKFKITNLPTLILIKDGSEVWRGEGFHTIEQLLEIIQKFK